MIGQPAFEGAGLSEGSIAAERRGGPTSRLAQHMPALMCAAAAKTKRTNAPQRPQWSHVATPLLSASNRRLNVALFSLLSRGPEEEKQVGLGHPRDPGPARPHHHHGLLAGRRLRDDHRQRHQDHRHLRGGHHPEEGEAVTRLRWRPTQLEGLCCPRLILYIYTYIYIYIYVCVEGSRAREGEHTLTSGLLELT